MIHKIKKFLEILEKLNFILTSQQKKKSIKVLLCILGSSALELISVSAVMPFVYTMLEPEMLADNKYVSWVLKAAHIELKNEQSIIYYAGIVMIAVFVLRGAALVWTNYVRIKFENDIKKAITDLLMNSYLCRPYSETAKVSSAEAVRGISVSSTSVYYILQGFFMLFSNMLTLTVIAVFMVCIDAVMTLELAVFGGGCVLGFLLLTQKTVRKKGIEFNASMLYVNQYAAEAIDGLKEITVLGKKSFFIGKFEKITEVFRKAEFQYRFLQFYPNTVIQTVFVITVITVACIRVYQGSMPDELIPSLAAFAYGAMRIMPALSGISSFTSSILYYYDSFNDAYLNVYKAGKYEEIKKEILREEENTEAEPVRFSSVMVNDLTWKYDNAGENVLEHLDITFQKGECIGLVGKSGAGKSTLADVLLGLLNPGVDGTVMADAEDIFKIPSRWSRTVGYVPQKVFLMDDTIKNNVLFGARDSAQNEEKVWHALEEAQIRDFVDRLPDGIETVVGEGGSKLSGGQRQRIAIARALFNDPELLILDEATSALDNETEKAVMKSIDYLQGKKTLIIIAHRLSTIENCDRIFEIRDGKAVLQSGKE